MVYLWSLICRYIPLRAKMSCSVSGLTGFVYPHCHHRAVVGSPMFMYHHPNQQHAGPDPIKKFTL